MTRTAFCSGKTADQALSIECEDGKVWLTLHQFTPADDPGPGRMGACFESVISFEVGAVDAVIRELQSIKRRHGGGES